MNYIFYSYVNMFHTIPPTFFTLFLERVIGRPHVSLLPEIKTLLSFTSKALLGLLQ